MNKSKVSSALEQYKLGNFSSALEIYNDLAEKLGYQYFLSNIYLCVRKLKEINDSSIDGKEVINLIRSSRFNSNDISFKKSIAGYIESLVKKSLHHEVNRESAIFKIFINAENLSSAEIESVLHAYNENLLVINRMKLVIYGVKNFENIVDYGYIFEGVLFESNFDNIKKIDFDVDFSKSDSIILNSKVNLDFGNFQGFCESIANVYNEYLESGILYFAYTTDNSFEAGYHRRSLNLQKGFSDLGVQYPIISFHSDFFNYKNNISFITNDKKFLEIFLSWLNPKFVVAASNHSNAKPLLDLKNKVGYTFVYEMRGLWHETYAAKMREINNNYCKENDSYYLEELEKEMKVVKSADKVIFICKEMAEYVSEKIPDIEINSEVIGNGYILKNNEIIKPKDKIFKEKFVIGYFGSITYYEGIKFMLEAIQDLINEGLSIKVLLIGKNSITSKKILDLSKYDFVHHEEYKKNILPFYDEINLFVVPRLPYEVCHVVEPLKPFDCFANKVPLLLSDCRVLKRISGDGTRCLTFKAGSRDDLKRVLRDTIKNGYSTDLLQQAWNWVNNSLKWRDVAEKYKNFINESRGNIYYLYSNKWTISNSWSGASINCLNEIAVLCRLYNVYYNDIYVNDLFEDGVFNEKKYNDRFFLEYKSRTTNLSSILPKILLPSRNYNSIFYRCGNDKKCVEFFLDELPDPKIFSHNFVDEIWNNKEIVGFQTEAARKLALANNLSKYDDDGTLGYLDCDVIPVNSFVRYQASPIKLSVIKNIYNNKNRDKLKKSLNSKFLIGVIGTIYEGTYPDILIDAVEKIRNKFPDLNAKIVIYTINVLKELPKKDWIIVSNYEKRNQEDALLQLDVIVNTWKSSAQIYSGSNKNIDAINHAIPLIAARTPSYVEQLGEGYPLFYDFDPFLKDKDQKTKESIYFNLIKCIDHNFRHDVTKYLIWRRAFVSIDSAAWLYDKQIKKLNKKVLLLIQNLNIGGVQKYSMQILESLSDCELTILSFEKIDKESLRKIYSISSRIRIKYYKNSHFLNECSYDYAFINSYPVNKDLLLEIIKGLKSSGAKIYPIVHSDIHPFTVEISKHLSFIDGIVTINKKIIDKIKDNTGFDFSSSYHHITPVLERKKDNLSNSLIKTKRSKEIAFFGRVAPLKCTDFLVKYFARYVKETSSEYKLLICGPSAHKGLDVIINECNRSAGREIVVLMDKSFNSSEREALFKHVDALVYTTATEGLPYTFIEANEMGTPVISSDVGAVSSLIEDGVNGFLFRFKNLYLPDLYEEKPYNKLLQLMKENEESNYNEFKRVMLKFESDDKILSDLSQGAINLVNKKFNFEIMEKAVRNIIFR